MPGKFNEKQKTKTGLDNYKNFKKKERKKKHYQGRKPDNTHTHKKKGKKNPSQCHNSFTILYFKNKLFNIYKVKMTIDWYSNRCPAKPSFMFGGNKDILIFKDLENVPHLHYFFK